MDDLPGTLARLTTNLEALERRVYALEHPSQMQPPALVQADTQAATAHTSPALPSTQAGGAFSVVGKAMLGIAGAYLLRALAESTTFPRAAVIAIAIVYAAMWLVAATRVKPEAWFASVAYAATSVLILVPMLWELTLRFRVFPPAMASSVLATFAVASFALAWKRHFTAIAWVTAAAGSTAALIMAIATHDLAPFIVALLIMTIAGEYAAACNRELTVRPLVAASADIALWALVYIGSRPERAGMEYAAVSRPLLLALAPILLLIYGASATAQTMLRGRRIAFFEVAQTLVAFLLASWSVLSFWSGVGAVVLGALCFFASAVGYAIAFARFGAAAERRNYHVYATGSLALFLAGGHLCLPPVWLVLSLSAAAIAATIAGVRSARLTLEFHGLLFLWAAAFSSGLTAYIFHAIAGTFPPSPAWLLWLVSAGIVLCYALERRSQAEQWKHRLLYVLSASLAACATAALLVWALARLMAFGIAPGASHIAVIRTLTACAMALVLAYSGSRWQRKELGWLAYGVLVFVASKLLFEDMRHGHLGFTAASIFLYAVTLLSVPRLVRLGQSARGVPASMHEGDGDVSPSS